MSGGSLIRVLVAEDSAVQMHLLLHVLERSGHFDIVGAVRNGEAAVAATRQLRPQIVLMDCHMPVLDGVAATRQIMQECPTPIVVVSATIQPEDTSAVFDAIDAGALSVLVKPTAIGSPDHDRLAREMVRSLQLMSEVKVVGRRVSRPRARPAPRSARQSAVRVIGIGGSTGAPAILADIIHGLAPSLSVPVLVVQHISTGFVTGFAAWLEHRTGVSAVVAADGDQLRPGVVHLAPDGMHMGVRTDLTVRLDETPLVEGFRPSVSVLFESMARVLGATCVGVLLSGMGRDGAAGMLALRRAGALTLAQDAATSVVFGMAGEAVRLDAASEVLPPDDIVRRLAVVLQKGS